MESSACAVISHEMYSDVQRRRSYLVDCETGSCVGLLFRQLAICDDGTTTYILGDCEGEIFDAQEFNMTSAKFFYTGYYCGTRVVSDEISLDVLDAWFSDPANLIAADAEKEDT